MTIEQALTEARVARGLSQAELARRAGVSRRTVVRYETELRGLGIERARALATVLRLEVVVEVRVKP